MRMKYRFMLAILSFFAWSSVFAMPQPRVIALVPSQTEMIFALGFGENLVGVTDYCNFPEQTSRITRVGALELNLEQIMSLRPNLLLDLNSMHRKYQLLFTQLGLNYVNFNITKLEDIPEMAAKIAQILGDESRSSVFIDAWKEEMKRLSLFDSTKKLRVYLEIWDTPMQAAGPLSYMDEMIRICGGENVVKQSSDYPVLNSEQVISADPEVILVAYPHPKLESIKNRPGWSIISAVKNNRIYAIDQDLVVRPGPRNLEALKIMQRCFWPKKQ